MGAIVFASAGGRKYHFDKGCRLFESAQILSDWDCCCGDYCTHRSPVTHPLKRMSATKAAMDGKLPCLSCVPPHLRELPEVESFGHRPVGWSGHVVCIRCHAGEPRTSDGIDGAPDDRPLPDRSVLWPCTSAIVLGLADRAEAAA